MLILIIKEVRVVSAAETSQSYTLAEILSIAQGKNPSVQVFQANIKAAQGELISARAFPNPDLEVALGKGKALEQTDSAYKREKSLTLGQSLEWPGKRLYRRKASEAEVTVAREELEGFRLELIAQVKETFFNVLFAERNLEVSTKNLETVKALVASTQLRVDSGEAPELERIKAQVEFLKATKDARRAKNQVAIAKAALNSLAGGTLGRSYEITGEFSGSEKPFELASLIDHAVTRHPLILRQQKALEVSGYAVSRERHSRVPDLTITGSAGEEMDKRSYAIGLSVPFPLFYQRQGEIATARAGQSRALAELERTRIELTQLVTQEYQNYRIALDQLKVFEEGLLEQANEALRIAQFSYQQGESDLLNLLDAQRVQRATLIEYYEAQFELQVALARLGRVTGGLE
jgi:cobalt-zinc-cadmium efflux system outer membrane protein